jgi:hypothetical protein
MSPGWVPVVISSNPTKASCGPELEYSGGSTRQEMAFITMQSNTLRTILMVRVWNATADRLGSRGLDSGWVRVASIRHKQMKQAPPI